MTAQIPEEKPVLEAEPMAAAEPAGKKTFNRSFFLGLLGVVITLLMIAAIIFYNDKLREMQEWGYIGAFVISILGGATVIVPVPMLPVVFALGGTMSNPWQVFLLGLAAAAGEVIGGLTIYTTGQSAGPALSANKNSGMQKAYARMLSFIQRRGALALFLVTFIVNPFFYPAAFASGALRMGLKKFVPVVIIGKLIKCMTVVYAGYFGLKGVFHIFGIEL
ncbi:MAG: VTT domain-containing protein [Dehalococcoidales bacterium]|jgi:membrane protein DedA with SNARE-associated domain